MPFQRFLEDGSPVSPFPSGGDRSNDSPVPDGDHTAYPTPPMPRRDEEGVASDVSSYFDAEAAGYYSAYQTDSHVGYFFRRRADIVATLLRSIPGDRLLDVGCGPGTFVPLVRRLDFVYQGVDVSERMVEEFRSAFGNQPSVTVQVGDVRALEVADRAVDVVLCLGVLEYLRGHDRGTALSEIRRVVRPGGTVILSVLNRWSPLWVWRTTKASRLARALGTTKPPEAPVSPMSMREAIGLVVAAGLEPGRLIPYAMNVFPARLFDRNPGRFSQMTRSLERSARTPLGKLALGFILTGTKPRDSVATHRPNPSD